MTRDLAERYESAVGNYFVAAYPPFSIWSKDGAEAFGRLLRSAPTPRQSQSLGLYVHIPFCVERCHYCYFLSYQHRSAEMDRYLDALSQELALYARSPALSGRKASFVYFGGGTPSLLSTARIRRLMGELQAAFPWTEALEVSFECAPKSVTEAKCRALRESGVTRLSLGVQQLDDDVLQQNGRVHSCSDVVRAYETIRRVGFDVVNIDLMTGLMGETDESFGRSLDGVLELAPESVTLYQLEIPFNTPLYRALRDGKLGSLPSTWETRRVRLAQGFARLEEAGYTVRSGYTAVRDPIRHRFVYQDEQYRGADLLGLGASSFSYVSGIHQQNLASLEQYLDALSDHALPTWRGHVLSLQERLVREFVLQLKLGRVPADRFRRRFETEIFECFAAPLARFAQKGWLRMQDDAVTLTREGLLRVDHLLPAFYLPQHQALAYC